MPGYKYKGNRYMFKKDRDTAQSMDRLFKGVGKGLKGLSGRRRKNSSCCLGVFLLVLLPIGVTAFLIAGKFIAG
jgi:hypothetical protein